MADVVSDERPLTFENLVSWFESGGKPADQWRVGAEHEKFVFQVEGHKPVPYEPNGIKALLDGMMRFGWAPVMEGETVIGLERNMANISLEPGGQFELSGAPHETMHEIAEETQVHLDEAKTVAGELGLGFMGLGFTPEWTRAEIPVMPKGRYKIMRAYMPKVGSMGLDMMFRTCTVQSNLDFANEADMIAKFRTSLALQPIATALFANSPFIEGKPSGFLSSRANVWTDTDNDRTGMLGFVFADGFGFETYARYALDVPMYFVKRGDAYIDVAGRSFRDFMAGGLPEIGDARASIKDWADHVTTIFPEVRLKKYLEMRGADVGSFEQIVGLSALWTGILYDSAALAAAWDLCKDWAIEDHERLRADVTRLGLKARIGGRTVQDVAKDMVEIAAGGLKARARLSAAGADETVHLESLRAIADSGLTGADRALALYHGDWNGDISRAYKDFAY
ncbi:glutamate--cysteine ligase [Phenylobacterium immobile]|uniref:glutamate--cysteine ligase n=1 Tax=Phenylobacterium immobile TaxID=21 RepID=UPI000ACF9531|nr:glutamate--cysteine ligase [Phenylobacterium immobile]